MRRYRLIDLLEVAGRHDVDATADETWVRFELPPLPGGFDFGLRRQVDFMNRR